MDFIYSLPPDTVTDALGANYNTVIRAWMLKDAQAHLQHHQAQVKYYKDLISRLEDVNIRYEVEPEPIPVSPAVAAGQPIKLSELAKQRNAMSPTNASRTSKIPATTTTSSSSSSQPAAVAMFSKDKKDKEKEKDIIKPSTDGTLQSSLAKGEAKFSKPKNVNITTVDENEQGVQEMTHFSRPRPAARNAAKRSDIQDTSVLDDDSDGEVSTWSNTPSNAYSTASSNGLKKDSKFKSAFGTIKSSFFKKDKDSNDDYDNSERTSFRGEFNTSASANATTTSPYNTQSSPQGSTYQPISQSSSSVVVPPPGGPPLPLPPPPSSDLRSASSSRSGPPAFTPVGGYNTSIPPPISDQPPPLPTTGPPRVIPPPPTGSLHTIPPPPSSN